jgi:hypothetical protein
MNQSTLLVPLNIFVRLHTTPPLTVTEVWLGSCTRPPSYSHIRSIPRGATHYERVCWNGKFEHQYIVSAWPPLHTSLTNSEYGPLRMSYRLLTMTYSWGVQARYGPQLLQALTNDQPKES